MAASNRTSALQHAWRVLDQPQHGSCLPTLSTPLARWAAPDTRYPPHPTRLPPQFLSPDLMSAAERRALRLREVVREFERFPGDTGSTEVQGEGGSRCFVFNVCLNTTHAACARAWTQTAGALPSVCGWRCPCAAHLAACWPRSAWQARVVCWREGTGGICLVALVCADTACRGCRRRWSGARHAGPCCCRA